MAGATPHLRNFSSRRALPLAGRRLSWPKWLVTYGGGTVVYPRTVTHLSTNRAGSTYSNFFDVTNAIAAVRQTAARLLFTENGFAVLFFSEGSAVCGD